MGSVIRKGKNWAIRFDVPSIDGRVQKQIGGFLKKADADRELKKIESDLLYGKYSATKDISVSEFIETWLSDHVKPNLAPKTYLFYNNLYMNYIKEYFSKIKLVDLKTNHIESFYRNIKNSKLSENSIHHIHKTLRASLNKAVKWEYIKVSPIANAQAPKMTRKKMGFWDMDEILEALNLFEDSPIKFHVKMSLLTGLREGEICALSVGSIDFDKRTIYIDKTAQRIPGTGIIFKNPKTDKSMSYIPMTDDVAKLLKNQIKEIKINKLRFSDKYDNGYDGYLSVWPDGAFIEPDYVSKKFRQTLSNQSVVKRIRFHDLRHSCASLLIDKGVDMKTVQEIMRHSDFRLTANTYGHISDGVRRTALEKLKLEK